VNLAFGEKDCRNFIAKERHLRLGTRGVEALVNISLECKQLMMVSTLPWIID
jgi:hypothetical protein